MKTRLLLISLSFLFYCCNNTKKNITTKSENEILIEKYFEYFNNLDFVKMANLYTDSASFKDPSLGKTEVKQTKQQIIEKYKELNKIFSDLNDKVIKMYPTNKNHVIVEFISSGTGPDKSKFELPICTIFNVDKGQITKDYTYYDNFEEAK
jgi:hypothetical protein